MRSTVAVCIPVRNEAATLPALLTGLQRQVGDVPFSTHFLLDTCTDESETLIRRHRWSACDDIEIVSAANDGRPTTNAGRARRAAMALGLARVRRHRDGVLLTTDADSVPAPDWVARAATVLRTVDVVSGRIIRRDGGLDPIQNRVEAYYDRLYALRRRLDPVAWEGTVGHHHTGGANMGFRAEAYAALGGFRDLAAGEDAAIIDEAGRAGLRVRRDADLIVETSSRRSGRARGGLACSLRNLAEGEEPKVGDPARAVWQYRAHAVARRAFDDGDARVALATITALDADHLRGVARDCPNAEAFAMRVVPAAPGSDRPLGLAEAERILSRCEAEAAE